MAHLEHQRVILKSLLEPGHIMSVMRVNAFMMSGRSGDAGLAPSLVVMPKSLVFNWLQEAARVTPSLRVLVNCLPAQHSAFLMKLKLLLPSLYQMPQTTHANKLMN